MGFYLLRRLLGRVPRQVLDCERALKEIRREFGNNLYAEPIFAEVAWGMKTSHGQAAIVSSISWEGNSAREVAWFALAQTAHRHLANGHLHIYRGVLSGAGHGVKAVYDKALDELVKSGFATEADALERRQALAESIKIIG